MNPIVVIRLEALRLALAAGAQMPVRPQNGAEFVALAKEFEQSMRRGLTIEKLGGSHGCGGGCAGKSANSPEAKRKRQQLLTQDVRALISPTLDEMTLAQLVTDYDITLTREQSAVVDNALAKLQLCRGSTGTCVAQWIETGKLPGPAGGKPYIPQ